MKEDLIISIEGALNLLYETEKKIYDALPNIMLNISSGNLLNLVGIYHKQNEVQIAYVESIFDALNITPSENDGQYNPSLVLNGEAIMDNVRAGTKLDRSIKSLLEQVILTKICAYTVLKVFTASIDYSDVYEILEEILHNEKIIFNELRDLKIPIVEVALPFHFSNQ